MMMKKGRFEEMDVEINKRGSSSYLVEKRIKEKVGGIV